MGAYWQQNKIRKFQSFDNEQEAIKFENEKRALNKLQKKEKTKNKDKAKLKNKEEKKAY